MEPDSGNNLPDGVLGPDPLGEPPVPPPDVLMPDDLEHQDETCRLLNELEASIEGTVVPPPPGPFELEEPVLDEGWGYAYPPWSSMSSQAEGSIQEALLGPESSQGAPAQPGLLPPWRQRPATGGSAGLKGTAGSAGRSGTHWCPVKEQFVTVCEEVCGDCEYFEQTGDPEGDGECGYCETTEEE